MTVAALQRYVADGYLSLDEFTDRSAAAFRATTYGELAALTADLTRADTPAADPHRNRAAGRISDRRSWSPVGIAMVVLVGVVLLTAAVMAAMMLGMMSGMDMGDMDGTR